MGEILNTIHTLPTFLYFKQGKEVHRVEGVPQKRPARAVAQAMRHHLLDEPCLE